MEDQELQQSVPAESEPAPAQSAPREEPRTAPASFDGVGPATPETTAARAEVFKGLYDVQSEETQARAQGVQLPGMESDDELQGCDPRVTNTGTGDLTVAGRAVSPGESYPFAAGNRIHTRAGGAGSMVHCDGTTQQVGEKTLVIPFLETGRLQETRHSGEDTRLVTGNLPNFLAGLRGSK